MLSKDNKRKFLIILISPSGGGKTAIFTKILADNSEIKYSVSFTTRKARNNEVDGVHYNFISEDKFLEMKKSGDFLESAIVHGYWYGTSKSYINNVLKKNNIIMDIDVQGAKQIMKSDVDHITIFILPPSREVWLERLKRRGTDSKEVIQVRLESAEKEIQEIRDFQYLVINDDLNKAVNDIETIIKAEENKIERYINIEEYYGG
ncbi:MAG: guanylate kinase [Candidatus Cloacimonadota bacterium]|nr:MAG: guanylate kinase [Candidatus Cloacimonadota bacterium]